MWRLVIRTGARAASQALARTPVAPRPVTTLLAGHRMTPRFSSAMALRAALASEGEKAKKVQKVQRMRLQDSQKKRLRKRRETRAEARAAVERVEATSRELAEELTGLDKLSEDVSFVHHTPEEMVDLSAVLPAWDGEERALLESVRGRTTDMATFLAKRPFTLKTLKSFLRVQSVQGVASADVMDTLAAIKKDFKVDAEVYALVLNAVRADADAVTAIEAEIVQAKLPPSEMLLGVQMGQCARAGDVTGAMELLARATEELGKTPGVVMQTGAIQACVKARDLKLAWKTYDAMTERGVTPDAVTYAVMMNVCAMEYKVERALNMWEDMQQEGNMVSDVHYNTLIKACAMREDYAHLAFRHFHRMRRQFAPGVYTYSNLLVAAGNLHNWELGEAIWNRMLSEGVRPNQVCFSNLLSVYASAHAKHRKLEGDSVKKAEAVFKQMVEEAGIHPSVQTLNRMLSVYSEARRHKTAEAFVETYKDWGHTADVGTYSALMYMWAGMRRADKTTALLKQMEESGVQAPFKVHLVHLHALVRAGRLAEAVVFLGDLKEKGFNVRANHVRVLRGMCVARREAVLLREIRALVPRGKRERKSGKVRFPQSLGVNV